MAKAKKKRRIRWLRVFGAILAVLAIIASIVAVYAVNVIKTLAADLPQPDQVKIDIQEPSVVYDRNGVLLGYLGSNSPYKYISLDEMGPIVPKVFVGSEDHRFYQHGPVDWVGITRAAITNVLHGSVEQGGSSITQQLARVMFNLGMETSMDRKLKEFVLAYRLEQRYTKNQVLELYLNMVYFGDGCNGIETAAEHYFGKTAKDLTLSEAALLAGVLPAPSVRAPNSNLDAALKARDVVLNKLLSIGYITQEQYEQAKSEKITLSKETLAEQDAKGYALDYIRSFMVSNFGSDLTYKGGLSVYTTFDSKLIDGLQKSLEDYLDYRDKTISGTVVLDDKGVRQPQPGAVIVDPRNGEVLAMVGGRKYSETQYNRAVAPRATGSSFKPIDYAAAIQMNLLTPFDTWVSEPIKVPIPGDTWSPHEFNMTWWGQLTVRDAIVRSSNIAAVKTALLVGIDGVQYYAKKFGITEEVRLVPSTAIGVNEISPLNLALSYAPFANGGYAVEPVVIREIKNSGGVTIYQESPWKYRVLDESSAYVMSDMLHSMFMGNAYTPKAAIDGRFLAGKSGTTSSWKDSWYVGYSTNFVYALTVGIDADTPEVQGAYKNMTTKHPGMWVWGYTARDLFKENLIPAGPKLQKPSNLVSVTVNFKDSELLGGSGQKAVTSITKPDAVPLQASPVNWQAVELNNDLTVTYNGACSTFQPVTVLWPIPTRQQPPLDNCGSVETPTETETPTTATEPIITPTTSTTPEPNIPHL
ncbi:transglycosylase domain-containing protein [Coprothermobacter platensis]|uniref:transglycosylase domain-containing protein n=1 Tax=Coprothermobacter platensis TaxID=108819 RepID=UPI00035D029F|nr:transglycosylase domain-containing protein [Coprothermobacter platensis]